MDNIEEMRKKLIESAKRKVTQKYEDKDVHIIKSVSILDDIDPISNLLIEQLREWHSVHFPELSDMVADHDNYLKLVYNIGKKSGFTEKNISDQINDGEFAQRIADAAKKSIGSNISEADLEEMKSLALNCINLRKQREDLSQYLEEIMQKELPHFTEIAGPVIGAKIFAKIGSKQRLAFVPASTIQMVGAEKALFMHIKKGVKGPKYGYLYQHPLVKAAKAEDKGRLARTIAAKLSIAAKMDYFGSKESAAPIREFIEQRASVMHGAEKKPTKETPKHVYRENREERREFRKFDGPRREYPHEERGEFRSKRKEWSSREPSAFRNRSEGRSLGFRSERRSGGFSQDRPRFGRREGGQGKFERRERPGSESRDFRSEGSSEKRTFGNRDSSRSFGRNDRRKPFNAESSGFGERRPRRGGGFKRSGGSRSGGFDRNKRRKFE